MLEWFRKLFNHPLKWFSFTILCSFFPVIARVASCLVTSDVQYFDLKDFVFVALALCLSNFNLIGDKDFKEKDGIAAISTILTLGFGVALTLFFIHDYKWKNISVAEQFKDIKFVVLVGFCAIFVVGTFIMSYFANLVVLEYAKIEPPAPTNKKKKKKKKK